MNLMNGGKLFYTNIYKYNEITEDLPVDSSQFYMLYLLFISDEIFTLQNFPHRLAIYILYDILMPTAKVLSIQVL